MGLVNFSSVLLTLENFTHNSQDSAWSFYANQMTPPSDALRMQSHVAFSSCSEAKPRPMGGGNPSGDHRWESHSHPHPSTSTWVEWFLWSLSGTCKVVSKTGRNSQVLESATSMKKRVLHGLAFSSQFELLPRTRQIWRKFETCFVVLQPNSASILSRITTSTCCAAVVSTCAVSPPRTSTMLPLPLTTQWETSRVSPPRCRRRQRHWRTDRQKHFINQKLG